MRSQTDVHPGGHPGCDISAMTNTTTRLFSQLKADVVGLAGLEPAASSLSGIEGSALCGPAFSQVAAERQGRRDAFLATLVPSGAGKPGYATPRPELQNGRAGAPPWRHPDRPAGPTRPRIHSLGSTRTCCSWPSQRRLTAATPGQTAPEDANPNPRSSTWISRWRQGPVDLAAACASRRGLAAVARMRSEQDVHQR
jgi:hypothetical protein